jgi:hypothetical protein
MSTTRQKAKPVFDPSALDDDLDDLWPAPKPKPTVPRESVAPVSSPAAPAAPAPVASASAAAPVAVVVPAEPAQSAPATRPPAVKRSRPAAASPSTPRTRPPEVLLSAEVYEEFYRVLLAEKKLRRGLARTMGTIVLDAIEAHAPRLATTWANQQAAVGEGQLFERPSSNAVPRRRRHAHPPRTVVLSGVTASNAQRLDDLVLAWNAGTRSALVEQALRYAFELLPQE